MTSRFVRAFDAPDEVIELDRLRSEIVTLGGLTISHEIAQPGWRWSTHVRPHVGTSSCLIRHVGVMLRGTLRIRLDDGSEFDIGPGEVMDIPAGHDGWVVGEEPVETYQWSGARTWLEPVEALGGRVLATIVVTDIVDSTGIAGRLGDRRWSDLLAEHDLRLRELVERYRGRVVKDTGDGILATFDGAGRAVRAAIAVLAAASELGLTSRAAVHTGEIEIAGDDIRGLAVHEATRMLGVGEPGHAIVSATTAQLARDAGATFQDLGVHRLRGIEGERHLYRAVKA
jgi:class 3 adenylate cyclase